MKGVVNTIFVILISFILLSLVIQLSTFKHSIKKEESGLYILTTIPYYYDDVSEDIKALLPNKIKFINNSQLLIEDMPAVVDVEALLNNYNDTLTLYSSYISANLSLLHNISSNTLFLHFSDSSFLMWNYSDPHIFLFLPSSSPTNYTLNYSFNHVRKNITPFEFLPNGDLYVVFRYSDKNGSRIFEGFLNSSYLNNFSATFEDGSEFNLSIGRIDGFDGSIKIVTNAMNLSEANLSCYLTSSVDRAFMDAYVVVETPQGTSTREIEMLENNY